MRYRQVAGLLCLLATPGLAQRAPGVIAKRNLLMHVGTGPAVAYWRSSDGHISTGTQLTLAVEIAAFYSLSSKWSLGLQYMRIGGLGQESGNSGRMNGVHLCASRRLFNSTRWYGEATVGLGLTDAALWRSGDRLPEEARWGSATVEVRAGRMWSPIVGTHALITWWPSGSGPLYKAGEAVLDSQGAGTVLTAAGAILTVGVFTRF